MDAMTDTRERLDILYAGTLPPHTGVSAIVGYQLLADWRVWDIVSLLPRTPD